MEATTTEDRNDAEDDPRVGAVPASEAKEIALRFINGHFRNPDRERPRIHIPANPRTDDDIRIMAFIRRAERIEAAAKEAALCWDDVIGPLVQNKRGAPCGECAPCLLRAALGLAASGAP